MEQDDAEEGEAVKGQRSRQATEWWAEGEGKGQAQREQMKPLTTSPEPTRKQWA